jgi:ZIP family zinc transporter
MLVGLAGNALIGVLAFGTAALLYLVTEELLVEAHAAPETSGITALCFAGSRWC